MNTVTFSRIDAVDLGELMAILNEDSLRSHLVDHPSFDAASIRAWVNAKVETDSLPGCSVSAVVINGALAGWCGIQPDDNGFEIAIVLAQRFWGAGRSVFRTLLQWAHQLGHQEVVFHLLDSRRDYKLLARKARRVCTSQLLERTFATYTFPTGQAERLG